MSKIDLYNGDCLELMKNIPDKSVNLVCMDPPYNIGKDKKWDKWKTKEAYVEFMLKIFKECERVLADNGAMYFFHNDIEQIAMLMSAINSNTSFIYNSFIIWNKGDFRALSWKNPNPENNNLRSWFNTCEYCLYYVKIEGCNTKWNATGLKQVYDNPECFKSLKEYFYNEKQKAKLTNKEINTILGTATNGSGMAGHYFKLDLCQWTLPTKEMYEKLQTTGYFKRKYEDLRCEYEDLRYIHNLDENHNNVWISNEKNSGKNHPCQKPIDILERIIKCSTKEEMTVLDPFMGSGSTGVACKNTNRNFIGIELDKKYFDIAKKRIEEA